MNKTLKFALTLIFGLLAYYIFKQIGKALYTSSHPKETAWTPEYNKKVFNSLCEGYGEIYADSDKAKLAYCVVNKLKIKYPDGINAVNTDSLKLQTKALSKECSKEIVLHIRWSPAFINQLKDRVRQAEWFQGIKDKYKDSFCDCFVKQLQNIYPNGPVDSITHSDRDSAIILCAKNFKKINSK